MAKCKDCPTVFATYGGSKGTRCPICKSTNVDASMEEEAFDPNKIFDEDHVDSVRSKAAEKEEIATFAAMFFGGFLGGATGGTMVLLFFWNLM